ncbi:MAG: HAD-IIIC family phosphatase [Ruminococcus sp.]|jgi:FkbH-like protein|nr:HAD-IIIC family phosphatase [Ruminococcus sp.]
MILKTKHNSPYADINRNVFITDLPMDSHRREVLEHKTNLLGNPNDTDVIPFSDYLNPIYDKRIFESDNIIILTEISDFIKINPSAYFNLEIEKTEISRIISQCEKLIDDITAITCTQILFFLFSDFGDKGFVYGGFSPVNNAFCDRLNIALVDLCSQKGAIPVDTKRMIAQIGVSRGFAEDGFYSDAFIELMAFELLKKSRIKENETKKCLILDCDGVLWDGILEENDIHITDKFKKFQTFVYQLFRRGVILAIASKNNPDDVKRTFKTPGMILKEEYIAAFAVNWENKPENIKHIAKVLNIGLDSCVFVDDTPFEVEAVSELCPGVTSLLFDEHIYEKLSVFNLKPYLIDIDENAIASRMGTYQTNWLRENLRRSSADFDEFIRKLEIVCEIRRSKPDEFSRIAELSKRTNQMSNGIRLTENMVINRSHVGNFYIVNLKDKFSDLGLVGAIYVYGDVLELFCMSCRAMGRGIEQRMIDFIKAHHNIKKFEYEDTGKNEGLKKLLESNF